MKLIALIILGIVGANTLQAQMPETNNAAATEQQEPQKSTQPKQVHVTVNFNVSNAHKQENQAGPDTVEQTTTQQAQPTQEPQQPGTLDKMTTVVKTVGLGLSILQIARSIAEILQSRL